MGQQWCRIQVLESNFSTGIQLRELCLWRETKHCWCSDDIITIILLSHLPDMFKSKWQNFINQSNRIKVFFFDPTMEGWRTCDHQTLRMQTPEPEASVKGTSGFFPPCTLQFLICKRWLFLLMKKNNLQTCMNHERLTFVDSTTYVQQRAFYSSLESYDVM